MDYLSGNAYRPFAFVLRCLRQRRDIFSASDRPRPSYFSDHLPGMLTGPITATSNAVYTVENMLDRVVVLIIEDGPPDRLMPGPAFIANR